MDSDNSIIVGEFEKALEELPDYMVRNLCSENPFVVKAARKSIGQHIVDHMVALEADPSPRDREELDMSGYLRESWRAGDVFRSAVARRRASSARPADQPMG